MIQTFSSTIRRKEMDAVLTCMVDEKTGPGELNSRFVQGIKEFFGCDGAVAFRSPSIALSYILKALDLEKNTGIMVSALAPYWQLCAIENLGYKPVILDVREETGLIDCQIVQQGFACGGRLLILHESMGILPEIEKICALGIPVIEDVSQSVGATVEKISDDENVSEVNSKNKKNRAGTFGIFSIMGLEEFDTVTGGGGAVVIAPQRRDWIVLKKYTDCAPSTDILPDINSALALVQLKEFNRNENLRKIIYASYVQALRSGKNRTFNRGTGEFSTVWSFPVVLSGAFKDVKQYAAKKGVEIKAAYEDSIISHLDGEKYAEYKTARSLSLRTALFPLYPRLGSQSAEKIARILGTLP